MTPGIRKNRDQILHVKEHRTINTKLNTRICCLGLGRGSDTVTGGNEVGGPVTTKVFYSKKNLRKNIKICSRNSECVVLYLKQPSDKFYLKHNWGYKKLRTLLLICEAPPVGG